MGFQGLNLSMERPQVMRFQEHVNVSCVSEWETTGLRPNHRDDMGIYREQRTRPGPGDDLRKTSNPEMTVLSCCPNWEAESYVNGEKLCRQRELGTI